MRHACDPYDDPKNPTDAELRDDAVWWVKNAETRDIWTTTEYISGRGR